MNKKQRLQFARSLSLTTGKPTEEIVKMLEKQDAVASWNKKIGLQFYDHIKPYNDAEKIQITMSVISSLLSIFESPELRKAILFNTIMREDESNRLLDKVLDFEKLQEENKQKVKK